MHDGNAKCPHVILASGKHSNGFFNSEIILEHPILVDEISSDIVDLLEQSGLKLANVDRVIGPAFGAITLAHDIARHISRRTGKDCKRAYPIKIDDRTKEKSMHFEKTKVKPGELILGCEDVSTTTDSIKMAMDAARKEGGLGVAFIGMIVNRSGNVKVDGAKIISLITRHLPTWDVKKGEECPLCRAGSEAIAEAKKPANWARLNAEY